MKKHKKGRLTAIEKSRRVLEILNSQKWILNFGIIPPNSLDDTVGYDVWVSFRRINYKHHREGSFPFQVLSSLSQVEEHLEKHPEVSYIVITRGLKIRDALYKYLIFLYRNGALNENMLEGLPRGMSFPCPLKCGRK